MGVSEKAQRSLLHGAFPFELGPPDGNVYGAVCSDWRESIAAPEFYRKKVCHLWPHLLASGHDHFSRHPAYFLHRNHSFHGSFWTLMVWLDVSPNGPDGNGISENRI